MKLTILRNTFPLLLFVSWCKKYKNIERKGNTFILHPDLVNIAILSYSLNLMSWWERKVGRPSGMTPGSASLPEGLEDHMRC